MGQQAPLLKAQFGLLTVVDERPGGHRQDRRVLVRCECGVTKIVLVRSLRAGTSKSCGLCARHRADPERRLSATARVVVQVTPTAAERIAQLAAAHQRTPVAFCREAIETFVFEDHATRVPVAAPCRQRGPRDPDRATVEMCIRVTPETREAAERLALHTRSTLTVVVRAALNAAAADGGAPPVFAPPSTPGFASRHAVGLSRPYAWTRKFPSEPDE